MINITRINVLLIAFIFTFLPPLNSSEITIWSLKDNWWEELSKKTTPDQPAPIFDFINTTQSLVKQIDKENENASNIILEGISKNLSIYYKLKEMHGWDIKKSPSKVGSVTISDILDAAQKKRILLVQISDIEKEIDSLSVTKSNLSKEVSKLFTSYQSQIKQSLEQFEDGLELIISRILLAIVDERIRILKENLQTTIQQVNWETNIIEQAKTAIQTENTDLDLLINQAKLAQDNSKELEKKFYHTEAHLLGLDNSNSITSLKNINSQIQRVRSLLNEILLGMQINLIKVERNASPPLGQVIFDTEKMTETLSLYSKQANDWLAMIRKKQDISEKSFIIENEKAQDSKDSLQQNINAYNLQKNSQDAISNIWQLQTQIYQAQTLNQLIKDRAIQRLGFFSGISKRFSLFIFSIIDYCTMVLSYPLFYINETPLTPSKLVYALIVFSLAYTSSIMIQRMLTGLVQRKKHISAASMYTFSRVTHYSILCLGFFWALSTIGLDFSNLLLITGALSVGIGFGLQGIVNNFLGGLIVLFDRKIRIGDFIELSTGEKGRIAEVNVQNTLIRTSTGHDILVPNSQIISNQLTNWTLRDHYARLHISFGVAYGSDKQVVQNAIIAAALKVPETVSEHKTLPDPNVWLVNFGESSLDFELVVWVDFKRSKKREASLKSAYLWQIETALAKEGIEIPFPQRDIHMKTK